MFKFELKLSFEGVRGLDATLFITASTAMAARNTAIRRVGKGWKIVRCRKLRSA